jgi:hypothetical protein
MTDEQRRKMDCFHHAAINEGWTADEYMTARDYLVACDWDVSAAVRLFIKDREDGRAAVMFLFNGGRP